MFNNMQIKTRSGLQMKNYVENKVIVITGASSGFGFLTAQKTAAMGAKVVAAARNEAKLKDLVAEIKGKGQTAEYVVTDVTNRASVQRMIKFAVDTFGRVDVLINDAGTMPLAFFSDHEKALDAWENCIDVNIKGALFGITAVYDQMIKQGEGHIINLSSIYGNGPVEGSAVYGLSKYANGFFADALRVETKGKIRVTTIRPTGSPTGLNNTVINFQAARGIFANTFDEFMSLSKEIAEGKADPAYQDPESIKYFSLSPEYLADAIVYAINQPMGVSISDITVRASGDFLTL
jgi:NADP-dependent 3-hydroxy acid dehydrogenase YdfG